MAAVLPLRRAPSTVMSAFAPRHLHPLPHRARGEAAEDHVVRSADPGAGEHRHDDLGNHRQEDPDHVPLADTEVLQAVGQALHVAVQVGVGDVAFLALLATPVVGDAVAEPGFDVPIQAVVGDVERAVGEPGDERCFGLVEHRAEGRVPVQFAGPPGPVTLGIPRGSRVHLGIRDARPSAELRWRFETLDLAQLVQELLELRCGLHDLGVVPSVARRYLLVHVGHQSPSVWCGAGSGVVFRCPSPRRPCLVAPGKCGSEHGSSRTPITRPDRGQPASAGCSQPSCWESVRAARTRVLTCSEESPARHSTDHG